MTSGWIWKAWSRCTLQVHNMTLMVIKDYALLVVIIGVMAKSFFWYLKPMYS
jgi:hypothetical protein